MNTTLLLDTFLVVLALALAHCFAIILAGAAGLSLLSTVPVEFQYIMGFVF